MTETPPRMMYIILGFGLIAVSFAAILIRFAQMAAIPSLYIATFRLLGAASLLTPITLIRHHRDFQKLNKRDVQLLFVSGVFLALHFAFWTISLEYTTVLISVTLVTTTPIWAAMLEWGLLRQVPHRAVLIGMTVAILGGLLLGIPTDNGTIGSTPIHTSNSILGGGLALAGAISIAVYLTVGRKLRTGSLPLLLYIWIVYSVAGGILLIATLWNGIPLTGYSAAGYGWLIALAIIPQLIGHSALNYAVRYVSSTYLSVLTKLEPIVSAVIAYFLFGEITTTWEIIGSVVILVGIIIASIRR